MNFYSHPVTTRGHLHPIEIPDSESDLGGAQTFYATHYFTPVVPEDASGVDITINGAAAGPKVSVKNFCVASMEGAISVKRKSGALEHFTFIQTKPNCTPAQQRMCRVYRGRPFGCAVFRQTKAPLGSKGKALLPYRTVAVGKHSHLKYGDVVFIEEAEGAPVTLPDGKKIVHDGFFLVADRGGLPGNKIDIYIGETSLHRPKSASFINDYVTLRKVRRK